ncbi:hypothetical protein SAMN05518861_107230 [Mesorhizobium sp. YR577]|nr:hypothetical protein SAMN05518861_107230 [Mesorhizobium sp. YR577]
MAHCGPLPEMRAHFRMDRLCRHTLPDPETFLPFMKRTSVGTPSLILRCERQRASKDAPIHRHARVSPSGHCQRSGSGALGRAFLMFSTWRDFRAPLVSHSKSQIVGFSSAARTVPNLSRSRPVTTPAPCTFHGQDAAGSPHGFGQWHLRRARSTPACVGPSGPWLPHQGGRSPPLPLDPGSRPGPARAMRGLCRRCLGVGKDWG